MKFHLSMVYSQLATCSACPHGVINGNQLFCASSGQPIDPMGVCPLGKWKFVRQHADGSFWIPLPDEKIEAEMDAKYQRIGPLRWKKPDSSVPEKGTPEPGFLAKAKSFVKAVTSGKADAATVERRKLSCFGDAEHPQCSNLYKENGRSYCGGPGKKGCGCGRWVLAELDGPVPKLEWAHLDCPLRRPGFSNSLDT